MTTLISKNNSDQITYADFYNVIFSDFKLKFTGIEMPSNIAEYNLLVEKKKIFILEDLHVDLNSRDKNISKDHIAKMLWDLTGGYKQIQDIWCSIIDSKIKALKQAKTSPDNIVLIKDSCTNTFYALNENSKLNVSTNGDYFYNSKDLILTQNLIENNTNFSIINDYFYNTLINAFFATEIAVDIGNLNNNNYGDLTKKSKKEAP